MTLDTQVAPLEESIEVSASPETVWALISDLTRLRRWSPQWPGSATLLEAVPHRLVSFRLPDGGAIWSFLLERTVGGGTTITERRIPQEEDAAGSEAGELVEEATVSELRRALRLTLTRLKTDLGG